MKIGPYGTLLIKKSAVEQNVGRQTMRRTLARLLAIGLAGFAAAVTAPASAEALHGKTAVTCTNPYSGATWQIAIDYDSNTVDANPASVSEAEISWRDLKDGSNYTLDRKSGKLTVIVASSTGGYFLYDSCKLEN
jgi:hypothetical protein